MKRSIYFAVLVAVASLLFSCAAGLQFTEMYPNMVAEKPEMGRVFFYRATGVAGAALQPKILLNGKEVGKSVPMGFFYLDLPPGNYEAVTTTEVKRKVSFTLEKGQTRFIRFKLSWGFFVGHVYGELVDESVGLSEIKNCKYTGNKNVSNSTQGDRE